jgi:glycine cleavage system H protein
MFKIRPDDMAEINDLIRGPEAVGKWILADIEKYRKD